MALLAEVLPCVVAESKMSRLGRLLLHATSSAAVALCSQLLQDIPAQKKDAQRNPIYMYASP